MSHRAGTSASRTGVSAGMVTRLLRAVLGDAPFDRDHSRLARGAGGTLALKVVFYVIAFLTSILLARTLGPSGFGAYAYAMAWVVLLGIPATIGMDRLLVRDVAAYAERSSWAEMRGLIRRSNQSATVLSLLLAAAAALVCWLLRGHLSPGILRTLWVSLGLIPVLTLMRLRQSTLQGLHRVVTGQFPELLVMPLTFVGLVGAALLLSAGPLTAPLVMGMQVAAGCVALLVGTVLVMRALPASARGVPPVYETATWMRSAWPLFLVAAMNVVNERVATILLGALRDAESVGVFSVVQRGSELIAFFFLAVGPALAPTIASLSTRGDALQLQQIVVRSARATLVLSLPVGLLLIGFGDRFLLLYGPDFASGRIALAILCVGQLVNVALGPVSLLLLMSGHERDAAWSLGVTALIAAGLNAALIPGWGVTGAATATAATVILRSLLLTYLVARRLGVRAHAAARVSLGPVSLRHGGLS